MTLIYFVLILGLTIFVHELGHFIFAKRAKVYCYEFALGMGPKLFGFRRKNDETEYTIRLFPIGGYVKMAGEEVEDDSSVNKKDKIYSKNFFQRILKMVAGALFNFLFGILILFLIGIFYGSEETRPIVGVAEPNYSAYKTGLREGDLVLNVDGKKAVSWDDVLLTIEMKEPGEAIVLEVRDVEDNIKTLTITPTLEVIDDEETYIYGFGSSDEKVRWFIPAIKYSITKFGSNIRTMFKVVSNLITGKLSVGNLAGPIGIYNIVGERVAMGFADLLYLIAFLSINVGFINLLPFPALDGGRILFLIIEKIRKKPLEPKIENIIHTVGFALFMILMVLVTIQDVKNIFN